MDDLSPAPKKALQEALAPTKRDDHRREGMEKAAQLATQKTPATTKMDDHKEEPGKAMQKAPQKAPGSIKLGDHGEGPRRTTQLAAQKTPAPIKMVDGKENPGNAMQKAPQGVPDPIKMGNPGEGPRRTTQEAPAIDNLDDPGAMPRKATQDTAAPRRSPYVERTAREGCRSTTSSTPAARPQKILPVAPSPGGAGGMQRRDLVITSRMWAPDFNGITLQVPWCESHKARVEEFRDEIN